MSNLPIQSVTTPEFGVCEDKLGSRPSRCVLTPTSCDLETESYVPAYKASKICKNPEKVNIGRCTSTLDDKRCAPSESACGTRGPFFNKLDSTCTLVGDTNTADASRTTFPACQSEDYKDDSFQCVLDETDCFANERVNYAKWASDWGPHECHCEHVPTGVCYTGSSSSITRENSFCAVTSEDCPSSHLWMSAREFLHSSRASYDCRLCNENKIGSKSSYAAGACLKSGASREGPFFASSFDYCALESSDCSAEPARFVPAVKLEMDGLHCPIERTGNWGTCASTGEPVECTNKAESCKYSFRFEQNNSECSIHGHSEKSLPTYFSYCAPRTDNNDKDWREIRCVWDKTECELATERWEEARLPNNAWFDGCTCEDVYTGVCLEPSTGDYYCAVNGSGCSNPILYVPQHRMKDLNIDMECQLCASGTIASVFPPTSAPVAPTPTPTISPVKVKQQPTYAPITADRPTLSPIPLPTFSEPLRNQPPISPKISSQSKQQELSMGAVIGIALGAVAALALFVIICNLLVDSGTQQTPQVSKIDEDLEDLDNVIEDPNHDEDLVVPDATIT